MNTSRKFHALALAVSIAAACSWASAQDTASNALTFDAHDTRNFDAEVDLIVKGPEDFYLRESFGAGEPIEIIPTVMAEGYLPDGTYRYELQVMGLPGVTAERDETAPPEAGNDAFASFTIEDNFGTFSIEGGQIVSSTVAEAPYNGDGWGALKTASSDETVVDWEGSQEQTFAQDVEIQGSLCVGFDCTANEVFGSDTIRLKENNLRIHFEDTSNSGSFPNNDWRLTANDQANGGANKFSIDDVTGGRTPFTVEAGTPSNALYLDSSGNIGLGTSTPVVEAHIVDGDTPTVRLQQDGSSGFAAQTWDMAGNETNFFIRDASNGSTLPFRIRPGAPTNSIYIKENGYVGMGTNNPTAPLDVSTTGTFNHFRLSATGADPNTSVDFTFTDAGSDGELRINIVDGDTQEFALDADGNLTIMGTLTANGSTFPDYVFADDYVLMPLDEVQKFIQQNRHLPNVPSAKEIEENGLNMTDMQKLIMEKVEELTLYTIQQQEEIDELHKLVAELKSEIESLK